MDRLSILFNLQLFAEDRTEKATPKRREEARKRGQVVRSAEINSAIVLLCTFLFLKFFCPWLILKITFFTNQVFSEYLTSNWGVTTAYRIIFLSLLIFIQVTLPIMGVAFVAGLASNFMQVGFLFNSSLFLPKLERINPIEGFKRIFSRRSLMELFKAILKVTLISYLTYSIVRDNSSIFLKLFDMSITGAVSEIAKLSSTVVIRIGIFLLIIAVIDYFFQYWEHERAIMMTKQELKEEFRQYEGDPQIRARLRQRQKQIAFHRMMQQVPKADVVITNPYHYAVALRYVPEEMAAPTLLAKGINEIALKIKAIAQENEITIYEDPPLAQALYKNVEIGQMIPPELYEAVAHVLAFVYRLRVRSFHKRGVS